MGKLNKYTPKTVTSPIQMSTVPNAHTALGGIGYAPANAESELFDLGINLFAGEDNYHESGQARDNRFTRLVEAVAVSNPAWITGFLGWLRSEGNIRTASIMGAVVAVHARLNDPRSVEADKNSASHGPSWNRRIVDAVCQRADEPGEFIAYWTQRYGKNIPMPVKRGLSDAARRLYNEYSFMKYDSDKAGWRIGDVIEFVHPKPVDNDQAALFGYAISARHGNAFEDMSRLSRIEANKALREEFKTNPDVLLNTGFLKKAGFTWEDALSLAGTKVDKAKLWESLIFAKAVPIFALIRNLRNMEQAGISRAAMTEVCNTIANPEVIAKSRLFPFQIYAAHKYAQSMHWKSALEDAMTYSTLNVPQLDGDTLLLIDASGSMFGTKLSGKSDLERVEAAAVFGAAFAVRNPDTTKVVTFSNDTKIVPVTKGMSMLGLTDKIMRTAATQQSGTATAAALKASYTGQKRVIIVTDEQSSGSYGYYSRGSVSDKVPDSTYLYSFDLAGHRISDIPSGKNRRHQLGGLTDKSFGMIPLLERGNSARWPWEK